MRPMKVKANRGSFLPVLTTLVQETTGPILELGMGFCSSPYLHWACYHDKRTLVSYESNPDFYGFAKCWQADFHKVYCIDDWDKADLEAMIWAIAFIDHAPDDRRGIDVMRVKDSDYLVIHDTENLNSRKQGFHKVFKNFKYRYKYVNAVPHTSIWSNKHDIRGFRV
jgi:hypothetical protein